MPGRYSHSVVLAGYSSQGIINLPNDKHVEYLRTSPFVGPPRVQSNANIRSAGGSEPHQRSQSAMAVRSGRWTPVAEMTPSPTRRYFINGDSQNTGTTRDSTPTYKPRKSIDAESIDRNLTAVPRSQSALGTRSRPPPQLPLRSVERPVQANVPTATQPERPMLPSRSSSEIRLRAANAAAALLQQASARQDASAARNGQSKAASELAEHARQSNLRHLTSNKTTQTKIHDPIRELEEPNFDDFSDAAEPHDSYFTSQATTTASKGDLGSKPTRKDHRRKSETQQHSQSNIMSRSRQSYNQSLETTSSTLSDHNRNLASDDSESRLYSKNSVSSLASSDKASVPRSGKSAEVKKSNVQSPIAQWGLPEIEEHGIFEPELFAQDLDHDLDQAPSSPKFGESTFGMISSGRDVDFNVDNDDALSDAASACPPDIGRYRDEEEATPPQFLARLKSEDARAPSPGLQSNQPKKGFLSRLKSKRSWL